MAVGHGCSGSGDVRPWVVMPLKFSALAGENFGLPAHVSPPDNQVTNGTSFSCGFKQIEGLEQNATLNLSMERHAEVVAHRPGNEDGARHLHCFSDVSGDGDRHGRHASSFHLSLN